MGTQQASTSKPQKPTCPVILIIGATGLTGRYIIDEFDREPSDVHIRLAARRPEQIERLRAEGRDAVLLDLDDPRTFGAALAGVDRLFLLTGYTVAMLAQSKTLVDAAKKARVQHIVHLGIFGNWDCTDPHFAWHQLVECYIEASGIAWTHSTRTSLWNSSPPLCRSGMGLSQSFGATAGLAGLLPEISLPLRRRRCATAHKSIASRTTGSAPRSQAVRKSQPSLPKCSVAISAARSNTLTSSRRPCQPPAITRLSRGTRREPWRRCGKSSTAGWAI
jgi:hypothetical protein